MLLANRLLEYQAEIIQNLLNPNGSKMFNYNDMIIDDSELANVLKERVESDNTFLISVLPSYNIKGEDDNLKWTNLLTFFVLDKTNYSEHDRDGFRQIFVTTQIKALAFIEKLIADKNNHLSPYCNFLTGLDTNSINVNPVWKKEGCNGWIIEINVDTNF